MGDRVRYTGALEPGKLQISIICRQASDKLQQWEGAVPRDGLLSCNMLCHDDAWRGFFFFFFCHFYSAGWKGGGNRTLIWAPVEDE